MNPLKEFQRGQKVRTTSGGELEVVEKLGEGGQGIVYRVNYNGKQLALKWYFGSKLKDSVKFYDNIQNNIRKGAPTDAFLWPQEITEKFEGSFGYLMELRPPEYKDFSRFLLAKERFVSIEAVLNAALCITNGFRVLHNKGYSYQDLNDGNFFVNPKTGDVLICDNDNVAPYRENLGIAGKCRYMAPEVVTREKLPDAHTDRFSLAVVLYLLLFLNHPLEGRKTACPCLTEELERKFYGEDPVFVWDPRDDSNRPIRGVHTNEIRLWPMYPAFIHQVFEEAFSRESMTGVDREQRVLEKKWQDTFIALRDVVVVCGKCHSETFVDLSQPFCKCINCGNDIQRLPVLKVKKYQIAVSPGKKVYACHVVHDSDDYKAVKGEIITSVSDPSLVGLKNNSGFIWNVILPNGSTRPCEDGHTVKMGRGLKINFGNGNIGEII